MVLNVICSFIRHHYNASLTKEMHLMTFKLYQPTWINSCFILKPFDFIFLCTRLQRELWKLIWLFVEENNFKFMKQITLWNILFYHLFNYLPSCFVICHGKPLVSLSTCQGTLYSKREQTKTNGGIYLFKTFARIKCGSLFCIFFNRLGDSF